MALASICMEIGLTRRKLPTKTTRSSPSFLAHRRAREPMLLVMVTRVALARSSGLASWGFKGCKRWGFSSKIM